MISSGWLEWGLFILLVFHSHYIPSWKLKNCMYLPQIFSRLFFFDKSPKFPPCFVWLVEICSHSILFRMPIHNPKYLFVLKRFKWQMDLSIVKGHSVFRMDSISNTYLKRMQLIALIFYLEISNLFWIFVNLLAYVFRWEKASLFLITHKANILTPKYHRISGLF